MHVSRAMRELACLTVASRCSYLMHIVLVKIISENNYDLVSHISLYTHFIHSTGALRANPAQSATKTEVNRTFVASLNQVTLPMSHTELGSFHKMVYGRKNQMVGRSKII